MLKAFLQGTIPLNKLDVFRELLEENAFSLTNRRHMSELLPFIYSQERALIKQEVFGRPVSVIFDETTRLGEAFAILLRFVNDDFKIEQRLVAMQLLAKYMCGEEIALELIHAVSTEYCIAADNLLAAMHDRASTNVVAMRTVKVVYRNCVNVGCFSHMLDLVGEKFITPHAMEFLTWWISMFSRSPKARLLWKEQTDKPMPGYSSTRRWSRWEVLKQVMELFGCAELFLLQNEDICPAARSHLLTYINDAQKKAYSQVEMAVLVDIGAHFVRSTYNLEGDGLLAFTCYKCISALTTTVNLVHCPNTEAVIRNITSNPSQQHLYSQHAMHCIQPGINYFNDCKNGCMAQIISCFKAARLFLPKCMK